MSAHVDAYEVLDELCSLVAPGEDSDADVEAARDLLIEKYSLDYDTISELNSMLLAAGAWGGEESV